MNSDSGQPLFSIFNFQFSISALIGAYACYIAVQHSTPIDRALPLIAVAIACVAWAAAEVAILIAVPLLIVAEIAVPDESMRLLAFGVIVAGAFAASRFESPVAAIAAIVLLRWIPFENVLVLRELALLALAGAIIAVLGRTPFASAVAVITALLTPAVPLRTFGLPLTVLVVAVLARIFGMPPFRRTLPSAVTIAFALTFFAWSGVVARAVPYFFLYRHPVQHRHVVNYALPPAASVTMPVPDGASALIVSGANVPRLRRGALLGRIEPGAIDVRIGDAADWGYMRRAQYYGSHNPLPHDPAGKVRGYGYETWVDGAGRIALPRGAKTIRVTASAGLPREAALQVEAFEIAAR